MHINFYKHYLVCFFMLPAYVFGQTQAVKIHWQNPKQFKSRFGDLYQVFIHKNLAFFCTPNQIFAYHTQNGKPAWRYPVQPRSVNDYPQDVLTNSRQHRDFIYLCQVENTKPERQTSKKQVAIKLHALTGKVCWKRALQANENYIPTQQGPPLVKQGKSFLLGLDKKTGKTQWKIQANMPRFGLAFQYQKTIYTSFIKYSPYPHIRPKMHLVALDAITGKIKWKTFFGEKIKLLFAHYGKNLLMYDKHFFYSYNLQGQKQWSFGNLEKEMDIKGYPAHLLVGDILCYLPDEEGVFFAQNLTKGDYHTIWRSDVNVDIPQGYETYYPLNYKKYLIVKITYDSKSLVLISKRNGQLVKTVRVPGNGVASRLVTDGERIFYADYAGTVYSISFP